MGNISLDVFTTVHEQPEKNSGNLLCCVFSSACSFCPSAPGSCVLWEERHFTWHFQGFLSSFSQVTLALDTLVISTRTIMLPNVMEIVKGAVSIIKETFVVSISIDDKSLF